MKKPSTCAEVKGVADEAPARAVVAPDETQRLLRDLQARQAELELQNQELRRVRLELESSQAWYFDLYEQAPVGYVVIGENGLIQETNLAAATLLGLSREELLKQSLTRFILKADQDLYDRRRDQLWASGAPQEYELRMLRAGADPFWAQVDAAMARDKAGAPHCRAVLCDISARKQAEAQLREVAEQYRDLVENMHDLVCTHDPQGRILSASRSAQALLGYGPNELEGRNLREIIVPESRTKFDQYLAVILRRGSARGLIHVQTRTGEHRLWEYDNTLRTEGVAVPVIRAFARDITETRRLEREKADLKAQNQRLQKNESLARMARAVAHHFNNQLQGVMGNLELTMADLPVGPGLYDNLAEAMQAARKAAKLCGLMLTYLGQTPGQQETLDLARLCRRNLPLIQATLPDHATLETDLPVPGPVIQANPSQLQQTLINLVTNAWEALGAERGVIRLAVKTTAPGDIPTTHRFPPDWQPWDQAHACLEVTDTAAGISPQDMENICEPFFSSKFIGRGLGLAVVLGIAKAHRGGIAVASTPGQGSVFQVFFPITANELPPSRPDQGAQAPALPAGATVLLVDDEDTVRSTAATMLTRLGFAVRVARDGVEAVEVFRSHQAEIRCVLCDLTSSRMNGWETMAALRALAPGLPVILSSGYDEAQVMTGDHPEWPQAFLGKPYEMQKLHAALDRALGPAAGANRHGSME